MRNGDYACTNPDVAAMNSGHGTVQYFDTENNDTRQYSWIFACLLFTHLFIYLRIGTQRKFLKELGVLLTKGALLDSTK